MPTKFLNVIQKSLKRIQPIDGIAYLLYSIDNDYWIPVATSQCELDRIPYYRLSYTCNMSDLANKGATKVNEDIKTLICRGKLESISIGAPFYQEIVSVGPKGETKFVIVKSSTSEFIAIHNETVDVFDSFLPFTHDLWAKSSLEEMLMDKTRSSYQLPSDVISKAVEILSDIYPFPPYFLHTDYILTQTIENSMCYNYVYSNPLGYNYWFHKTLGSKLLPWILNMAIKEASYREDLLNPGSERLKSIYKKNLDTNDVLANQLAKELSDDVLLIAYVPQTGCQAQVKLWARHNRPKTSAKIIDNIEPQQCKSHCEALKYLLSHAIDEEDDQDFLVVSWATWPKTDNDWDAAHVACDTSLKSLLVGNDLDNMGVSLQHPKKEVQSSQFVKIECRPVNHGEGYQTAIPFIDQVLEHTYEQLKMTNPEGSIEYFWKKLTGNNYYSQNMIDTFSDRHHDNWWISASQDEVTPFMNVLMSDLITVADFVQWQGFKEYDDKYRLVYFHIARASRESNIASELIEIFLGRKNDFNPTCNQKYTYIKTNSSDGSKILQALYLLRKDVDPSDQIGWQLANIESNGDKLVINISKKVDKETSALDIAQNVFNTWDDKDKGKLHQLRSGCTRLIACSKNFGITIKDKTTLNLNVEFKKGGD